MFVVVVALGQNKIYEENEINKIKSSRYWVHCARARKRHTLQWVEIITMLWVLRDYEIYRIRGIRSNKKLDFIQIPNFKAKEKWRNLFFVVACIISTISCWIWGETNIILFQISRYWSVKFIIWELSLDRNHHYKWIVVY